MLKRAAEILRQTAAILEQWNEEDRVLQEAMTNVERIRREAVERINADYASAVAKFEWQITRAGWHRNDLIKEADEAYETERQRLIAEETEKRESRRRQMAERDREIAEAFEEAGRC